MDCAEGRLGEVCICVLFLCDLWRNDRRCIFPLTGSTEGGAPDDLTVELMQSQGREGIVTASAFLSTSQKNAVVPLCTS